MSKKKIEDIAANIKERLAQASSINIDGCESDPSKRALIKQYNDGFKDALQYVLKELAKK